MNNQLIQQWKLGKLSIDITKLSTIDRVNYAKIENLLNMLVEFKEGVEAYLSGERYEKIF